MRSWFLVLGLLAAALGLWPALAGGTCALGPNAHDPAGWVAIPSPQTTGSPHAVAAFDLDWDGNLDIIVGREGGGLNAWRGDGGNSWADDGLSRVASTGDYRSLVVGVLIPGDPHPHLIAAPWDEGGIRQFHRACDGPCWRAQEAITTTGQYRGLSYGDIDGDGGAELIACETGEGLRLWQWEAGLWAAHHTPISSGTFWSTALGDVNGDGRPEIVAAAPGLDGQHQGIVVYAYGSEAHWLATPVTTTGAFYALAVGDVNGDRYADIVGAKSVGAGQRGITVWSGDGHNHWMAPAGPTAVGQYGYLDLGDVNGDGRLDILAASRDQGLSVWSLDASGTWQTHNANLPTTGTFAVGLLRPLDRDDREDILAAEEGNGLRLWTAVEASPPSFTEIRPSGWITLTQSPTLYADALDSVSGLDRASAAYRYSRDGGAHWSSDYSATVTGTALAATLSAASVPFGQDSAAANVIEFSIADQTGNTGTARGTVRVDTQPPGAPLSLWGDPPAGIWSNDNTVALTWSGSSDATSGVYGYSVVYDHAPTGTLGSTISTYFGSYVSEPLDDGLWYAHVRARDVAGNWEPSAIVTGPYRIDITSPTNPTALSSPSHTPYYWSNKATITMAWRGAADALSGIAGYSVAWGDDPDIVPEAIINTWVTTTVSAPLSTSHSIFFHLRTRDVAGNWSTTIPYGPFYVDVTPPTSRATSPAVADDTSFWVNWEGADVGSGVASYDLQYRRDSGPWQDWLDATTATGATFDRGAHGHAYAFRSRARDLAGNLEEYPALPDTTTTITPALHLPLVLREPLFINRYQ